MEDLKQSKQGDCSDKLTFEYVLDYKDLVSYFSQTSTFKNRGRTRIIETVLLLVVVALKIVDLVSKFSFYDLGFVAFVLLVVAVLWIVPEYSIRSAARRQADDTVHRLIISEKKIVYGYGVNKRELLADGNSYVDELKDMFVLSTYGVRAKILLPFRVISSCDIERVREKLNNFRQE